MKNLTVEQKIEKLLEMKVTQLRKNMKKIVTWDRYDRTYLEAIKSTIVKYNSESYPKYHTFISNIEQLELV